MLGALGFTPFVFVTYGLHRGLSLAPDDPPASAYAAAVLLWALVAIAATGFISRVLFGLQAEVQKARRLGQYTLGEKIGQGGMGVVYLAQHALFWRSMLCCGARPPSTCCHRIAPEAPPSPVSNVKCRSRVAQHIHSRPQPPSERLTRTVPPKLEALILGCLEKDPAQRPADADAFVAELDACDDVVPWDRANAERWWRGRGTELRLRPLDPNSPSGGRRTIDVGT